ncbi:hypothetical protein FAIPA1_80061 [Frankia sp. AiPs1]
MGRYGPVSADPAWLAGPTCAARAADPASGTRRAVWWTGVRRPGLVRAGPPGRVVGYAPGFECDRPGPGCSTSDQG